MWKILQEANLDEAKKKYSNNQHTCMYQTANSWVTEELRGWFYSWPLTTRYQQSNLSLLTPHCQSTHRLAGCTILAEKWYWTVYGNRELTRKTSHCVCVFSHERHSNRPSVCVGEECVHESVHGESHCWLTSGLIKEIKNITSEGGGALVGILLELTHVTPLKHRRTHKEVEWIRVENYHEHLQYCCRPYLVACCFAAGSLTHFY